MEPKKTYGRSLSDFGRLKPGEKKLLDACRKGNTAVLSNGLPLPLPLLEPVQLPGPIDLSKPRRVPVTEMNCVRADFIRFLLLGGDNENPVHEHGVMLTGAFIEGELGLRSCQIPVSLMLRECFFSRRVNAQDTEISGVFGLAGSFLAVGIWADRLKCSGSVFLRDGLISRGEIRLHGAHIGGGLFCKNGFFSVYAGKALDLSRSNVKGGIMLSNGFQARGEVGLNGAQIIGDLECTGGFFFANTETALRANQVQVTGNICLNNGFKAKGKVQLVAADIGGSLVCSGGHFSVDNGDSLWIERTKVAGSIFFKDRFKSNGRVILTATQVGSVLNCDGGHFEVKSGNAIYGERLNIKGNVSMGGKFRAIGRVDLNNAKIGGNFDCEKGDFEVKDGVALSLYSAVVHGRFIFKCLARSMHINLSHTKVGVLEDDLSAWANGCILDGFSYGALGGKSPINGIDRLAWLIKQPEKHRSAEEFRPQPWRQLQRVLREMGHAEDSKQVGIAFEDHLRKIGHVGKSVKGTIFIFDWWRRLIARGLHRGFGILAAYGYRPIRLLTWMLAVWLACGAAYWNYALPPNNAIAPSDPLIFQNKRYQECSPDYYLESGNWFLCEKLRSEYATFSPLAYSLDVMLPVVDLGLEKTWGAYIPSPKPSWSEELFWHWTPGHVVRLITWFQILFGWVSSLLLVAIISGFSRRNDEG
ncbi:MAG: hypothetical protein RR715_02445 [Comamonas sp.]